MKKFLKPDGKFFPVFPPWQNPFGGHQQICSSKILSKLPYFHLLPTFLYKLILKTFEKNDARVEVPLEIKETGISIDRLERILKKEDYTIEKRNLFLFNPNYETKFD